MIKNGCWFLWTTFYNVRKTFVYILFVSKSYLILGNITNCSIGLLFVIKCMMYLTLVACLKQVD